MSFWDNYKEIGGNFVKAEEKQVLMEGGIPFQITGIALDEDNSYGPCFVATVLLPDPENGEEAERSIYFPKGTVESRDRMLKQMMEYLDGEDADAVMVKLEKAGRSILIRQA